MSIDMPTFFLFPLPRNNFFPACEGILGEINIWIYILKCKFPSLMWIDFVQSVVGLNRKKKAGTTRNSVKIFLFNFLR